MNANDVQKFISDPVNFLGDKQIAFPGNDTTDGSMQEFTIPSPRMPTGHANRYEPVPFFRYTPAAAAKDLYFITEITGNYTVAENPGGTSHSMVRGTYLSWSSGRGLVTDLVPSDATFFMTAAIDGCCVLADGDPSQPSVYHINMTPPETDAAWHGAGDRAFKIPIWKDYYESVAKALHAAGKISATPSICDPYYYMHLWQAGGPSRVFGVKRGGNWTFYLNVLNQETIKAETVEIFPNRDMNIKRALSGLTG
ncbi:MAG: hypothetical protein HOI23_20900 [Deltaproteobacteria bacterium]|nr:hypothetical protein [Deltaproteobacteria bacterium]MBT6433584.1 hypothetical protein [Deltaproteobacteria bacterium]